MSDTAKALLPCPFCGGEATDAHVAGDVWFIGGNHADNCHFTDFQYSKAEAIAAWNTRTQPASTGLVEALEKCRDRFREYEAYHREKLLTPLNEGPPTSEIAEKIRRNREMAELCETALQALRSEAGDERAAIVAWLRSVADEQKGVARRLQREDSDYARHSIPACTECARHYDDAADAIERGAHLKSPPSLTREDEHG